MVAELDAEQTSDPTAGENLVSVRRVAAQLDISVRQTWRLLKRDDRFPRARKLGRSTRFLAREVDAYAESLAPAADGRPA